MFDFIKAIIPNDSSSSLLTKPDLVWKQEVIEGAVKSESTSYGDLKIIRYPSIILIQGSLHKFFNEIIAKKGSQNFDSFSLLNLTKTLTVLTNELGINPYMVKLQNVEIGVNIKPSISANELLDSISAHRCNLPDKTDRFRGKGNSIKFEQQRFQSKIYDKGSQYNLEEEVLRIECHISKMIHLKNNDIIYLSDLTLPDKLASLNNHLTEIIENLQIDADIYNISVESLTKPQQKQFEILSNRNQVKKLIKKDKAKLHRLNRNFDGLLKQRGLKNIKDELIKKINLEWINLSSTDEKTLTELTSYLSQFPEYSDNKNFNSFNQSIKPLINEILFEPGTIDIKEELYQLQKEYFLNTELLPGHKNNQGTRVCLTCHKDITHQDPKSIYCSEKFVGVKAAKRCRNAQSNPRNKLKYKCAKLVSGQFLFDQRPFIKIRKVANINRF